MDSGTARARVRASNGVHVPVVAALVAAAWAAPQEDELAEHQESVPGVVLPAAWVFGLESRPFNNSTERLRMQPTSQASAPSTLGQHRLLAFFVPCWRHHVLDGAYSRARVGRAGSRDRANPRADIAESARAAR